MTSLAQRIAERDGGEQAKAIAWRLERERDSAIAAHWWDELARIAPEAFNAVIDEGDAEEAL